MCQQHGTELVLLTYPLEHGEVASVMRTMGKQLGVDVVDVLERFAALNRGQPSMRCLCSTATATTPAID